jgi:hypothetical protein
MIGCAKKFWPVLLMSNYFSRYCALLGSADQLVYCQQADSLVDLLIRIKTLWGCIELGNNELLGEINRLNQMPVDNLVVLAGNWLPYRYQSRHRLVNWLVPIGYATEPFQDEYISRCSQCLFNQIIQPLCSLAFAQKQADTLPAVQPAGFIFHLSRCGSTLISGCLSELDSTCVFSEPPLLTELLLDNQLSPAELKISLQAFINLQAAAFSCRPQMIIKWNAWDIFRWDMIRAIYPNVPTIFLVRNPVEILASHQRSVGRHMSGDLSMAAFHPVFSKVNKTASLLDFRIRVLQGLLSEMRKHYFPPGVRLVNYRWVNAEGIASIAQHFSLKIKPIEFIKMQKRLGFHSKTPGKVFHSDHEKQPFNQQECESINKNLASIYNQLSGLIDQFKETSHVG